MPKNETKYGNITLGMINKMLISFIGENAFYYYCSKFHDEWELDWQSDEAFKKYIARLLREEEADFIGLNPLYEQSIYSISCYILEDLGKSYGLLPYIPHFINEITNGLFHAFYKNEYPVYETYHCFTFAIYETLKRFIVNVIDFWMHINNPEYIPFAFSSAKEKYTFCFEQIFNFQDSENAKLFKNKEDFYTQLARYAANDYTKKNPKSDKIIDPERFKKIIPLCINENKNPTLENFKYILEFLKLKGEISRINSFLVEAYITSNIEHFLKSETQIPSTDLEKIRRCMNYILPKKDYKGTVEEFMKMIFDNQSSAFPKEQYDEAVKKIYLALDLILSKHIYLEDENQTNLLLSDIKAAAPQASAFYYKWLTGYIELAKGNVLGAKNLYKQAFEARRYAGNLFELFIKQAAALSIYTGSNPDTVRDSIDPSKNSTSPLPKEAKKYWNYGYAAGIFEKPAEQTHSEYFHKSRNFYSVFSPDMFFEGKAIKADKINDFFNEVGIIQQNVSKEVIDKDFDKLNSLTAETINNRVRMFNNVSSPKISPLSLALYHAAQVHDGRFISLLKNWLGLEDNKTKFPTIDVDIISDMGVTPVNAAIVQYKLLRFKKNVLSEQQIQEMKDFKQIALKLIEKSNPKFLNIESKKTFRHPLQEAIETYDIEIVTAIIDKGLDINGLRISADACSPVYYTLMRIWFLLHSDSHTQVWDNIENPNSNFNWEKSNIPGMTIKDKMRHYVPIQKTMRDEMGEELFDAFSKITTLRFLGHTGTYEEQITELKKICFYLIGKTENQDKIMLHNKITDVSFSSLYLATEIDDADICRELLTKGANPNRYLPSSSEIPNTFMYRCISFKAWNTLEMYLTEFPELAKKTINDYDNPNRYTPLTFFLDLLLDIKKYDKKNYQGFTFVHKFCELFKSCGANFTIPSIYGNANEMLQGFQYL